MLNATYKITGEDLIDSVVDPLELSVSLNNNSPTPGDTIQAIAVASGGKQPYSPITYQWIKVDGDSGLETELAGQTFSSLVISDELSGHQVLCECSVSDSLSKSVTERSPLTSVIEYSEEVDTPELITPPDGAGLGAGISPESGVITDVTIEGANATMHGLRFDSTRSTKLSRAGSGTGTISYWKKDSSTAWVWQHEHQTGAAHPDEIGAGYDGYMSDYYFVEGQDLPADTFVGQFDGKTGPLDSSVILPKFQPKTIETDEITDVTPLTGTDVTLTFASDKDLALIEVGDTLFQDDSDINTSVAAVFAPINDDQDITTNLGSAGALSKVGTITTESIFDAKANSWGITSAASTSDSNSRLTCPLVTIGGDFTFDIFVNIKANSNAGGNADSFIVGDWGLGSNNFQLVWNNTSNANPERFKFYMNGQDVLTSAGPFGFNWYHIRITREGNEGKLYVDGKLESTGTISGQLNAAFSLFSRTDNNNNALVGNLTGFYLYNGVNLGAPPRHRRNLQR